MPPIARRASVVPSTYVLLVKKKIVMLALQECLIRLISNMHAHCGCVVCFFFSPVSGQLPSIYRGRKSKSAVTVRYYKWIVLTVRNIVPFH